MFLYFTSYIFQFLSFYLPGLILSAFLRYLNISSFFAIFTRHYISIIISPIYHTIKAENKLKWIYVPTIARVYMMCPIGIVTNRMNSINITRTERRYWTGTIVGPDRCIYNAVLQVTELSSAALELTDLSD